MATAFGLRLKWLMPKITVPIITFGVDPGTRNIGVCVLQDGKTVKDRWVIRTPQGLGLEQTIAYILEELYIEIPNDVGAAAVEGVVWYGKVRKIILPLSHVAGAIAGFLFARGIPTYLIPPAMKKLGGRVSLGPQPSEHEKDAAQLARLVYLAEFAASRLAPRSRDAVAKHKISVPNHARGRA